MSSPNQSPQSPNNQLPTQQLVWDAQRAMPGLLVNPYSVTGPNESAHGVMFGTLPGIGDVVVKPYAHKKRAANEAKQIAAFEEMGINTPPLQGLSQGNQATYLVTRRYPGLTTLGAKDLRVGIADPRLRREIVPAITTASQGIAQVHKEGAVHGDFQVRNVAHGPEGEFVAIDLENSQLNQGGKKGELLRARDLYMFAGSLLTRGLLEDRTGNYRVGFLDAAVVAPHAEQTSSTPSAAVDYERVTRALRRTAHSGRVVAGINHLTK